MIRRVERLEFINGDQHHNARTKTMHTDYVAAVHQKGR